MTLIELINHVGLENILVQPLEEGLHSVTQNKLQQHSLVTFGTRAITPSDIITDNPNRKVGFVLWIPKEKLPKV
jgi:hypothetical protein